MGDALNIEKLLNTGYFTSSRARSTDPPASSRAPLISPHARRDSNPPPVPAHGQVPRTVHLVPAPPSRKNHPPPVTVEDESVSLAREYGSPPPTADFEEEPPSRGDVDQDPVIIEVHQHNPERRFVIVPEDAKRQPPVGEQTVDVEAYSGTTGTDDRRDRPSSRKAPIPTESNDGRDSDLARSESEPRKSKHNLPPIDTEMDKRQASLHHRTRSAAPRPSPNACENRQSRPYGNQCLSPEKLSSRPSLREKAYRGTPQSSGPYGARSPSRTRQPLEERDRDRDRNRATERGDRSHHRASSSIQFNADYENDRPRRGMTTDADIRSRDEYSHARSDKRPEGPRPRLSPPRNSRDRGRSTHDQNTRSRDLARSSSKPVVIQDAKSAVRHDGRDESSGFSRSTSRTSTFPLTAAAGARVNAMARGAAKATSMNTVVPTPGSTGRRESAALKTTLPYPNDDVPAHASFGLRDATSESRTPRATDMSGTYTMPVPASTCSPRRSSTTSPHGLPASSAAVDTSQLWTPGIFDPAKDGLPTERPVGTYRRFSESNSKDGANVLPECPRRKPVAGLVDWLTLPHTSFNICPSCYDGLFSNSEYRTLFKPMLRPSDETISCDFGLSPWYRIAWLLTLKDNVPDLRLLQQIANVGASPNREPCPGSKPVTRSWLTVKDPQTRMPVETFSVCYQCARTVELLLPNLTGVFEPLDSRPRTDVCALHFTPDRKQFVLLFDALETTSDKAMLAKKPPDVDDLARKLWHLTVGAKCREDTPVIDGYWHTMQFLREFTVCANCFEDAVKPKLGDGNVIARNFYMKPQRLPSATCQLYSARMRDIFRRSCRGNDPQYLEEKVMQRRRKEKDIYDQLVKVDRANASSSWKEEQVGKLVDEWKRWE
ncbi:hypothetical protein E4U12_000011 [Claviceps purpurea]|nr:hypothetical protein E4U12_000011 [Claviceps purpurea]